MVLSCVSSTTYLRLCILTAFGAFAVGATATTTEAIAISENELPQVELDKIVVTATRTPTKISNTIAQARVINQEELQHYQGQTAIDILKRQPGFSYYGNGGIDKKSNFYMRGYDGKQILVLIDGIRYSSLNDGSATLNLLPADQIDRIEVLYGASGSSIYGADAMGGVIQIFTKGNNVEKNNLSITAGIGSNNQYLYGASAQFTNNTGTSLSLSASHNETDGFSAIQPGYYNYNKDDDAFDSNNFSVALNQRINEHLLAGVSALYSKSTSDFDSGLQDAYSDQENGSAQAYIDWRYQPGSSVKLQYGHSIDKIDTKSNFSSVYDSKQDQVSLVGQQKLPVGHGVYGLEYLKQDLESTVYDDTNNRDVKSAFLGYVLANNQFDAQANLRFDDNSQYGNETTYNLGGAYHINPDLRLGANYAKGFRAPSFYDIYSGSESNINLKAETSNNYEAFIEYNTVTQSTRLTGYHNKVNDLINFVARYDDKNQYIGGNSQNVEEAKIRGISLTSDWILDNYLVGGSYDYQKAKDISGGVNDGNFLPIRPEHKGLLYLGYRLPSLDIRAEYQYVGDYYYSLSNVDSQFVDHFNLFNISGNYQLSDNLSITARLNNIFNEKYVTAPGYNTDGTNFFTSLTYNWF